MVTNERVALWADAMEVAQPRPWIPEGGQFFAALDTMATEVLDPGQARPGRAGQGRRHLQERRGPGLLLSSDTPRSASGAGLPGSP